MPESVVSSLFLSLLTRLNRTFSSILSKFSREHSFDFVCDVVPGDFILSQVPKYCLLSPQHNLLTVFIFECLIYNISQL